MRDQNGVTLGGAITLGQLVRPPQDIPRPEELFPPVETPWWMGPVARPTYAPPGLDVPRIPDVLPPEPGPELPEGPPPYAAWESIPGTRRAIQLAKWGCEGAPQKFADACRLLEWVREDLEAVRELISAGSPIPGELPRAEGIEEWYEGHEQKLLKELERFAEILDECGCDWNQEDCTATCNEITYSPSAYLERIPFFDPGYSYQWSTPHAPWQEGFTGVPWER